MIGLDTVEGVRGLYSLGDTVDHDIVYLIAEIGYDGKGLAATVRQADLTDR